MTTSISVSNPPHATWLVQVTVSEPGTELHEVTILKPGEATTATIVGKRHLTVKEISNDHPG